MRVMLVVVALIALFARAERADACSCAMPRVRISPEGADAPINSTVIVWIPSRDLDVNVSLRKKTGETVAVDYRNVGAGEMTVVEMMPRSKLDPLTEYEIVRMEKRDETVVASFTTGKHEVTGTPAWKGVAKAGYFKAVPVCCMCMTADPYAEVELAEPLGEKRWPQYRFAIWLPGADGKLDYKKSPTTYVKGSDGLWLGHPSTCAPANFVFPKNKALKIGVKLVDLAGNASAPSEFVLDTTKPVRPPKN